MCVALVLGMVGFFGVARYFSTGAREERRRMNGQTVDAKREPGWARSSSCFCSFSWEKNIGFRLMAETCTLFLHCFRRRLNDSSCRPRQSFGATPAADPTISHSTVPNFSTLPRILKPPETSLGGHHGTIVDPIDTT